ncbi:MAG: EAL domain-containing protein, partial [Leptolyngbyaceae cyanobacterium MO_188.B28]|nr:EAL domain-containing protein [Leptolyngbyaceae cyanobacterium MO_188.B28]
TVTQVLNNDFDPVLIRDKIVLVGSTAPSLKGHVENPYSANQDNPFTPGVSIYAQMVSQLLDAAAGEKVLYTFLPEWGETLWLWSWALLSGSMVWRGKRPLFVFCAGGFMLLGLWGIGWLGLAYLVWLPIAEPMTGVIVSGGLITTQKLLYNSTHDGLTGLPDREVFIQHIHQALQLNRRRLTAQPVVVAFLDIDRFKLINQSLGHPAGDRVLLTVVRRLQQILPRSVQLSRVGGDEFALLFQEMTREAIGQALDTLQITLSEPFYLDQQRLSITVSVGMVIIHDNYPHKPEDLLRDAHTAMYRAKALGKFRYEVFATGMLDEAVHRLRLESDLLDALENQEFLLYYQPIVCLKSGQIEGFEALTRWRRQDQEFVMPSDFIPVTEEIGLIMSLGQWIFQTACRQLKIWEQQFPNYPLKMSINLSKRQLSQPDLVNQIASTLQDIGVNSHAIWLEITESMVMEEVEDAIDLMLRLKRLGLQLSIDDFGTGYSSLSYLHRFPMDTLKVDKSFVGRMEQSSEDWEIVDTIITLGHKLGMNVVAEGIETPGQMIMLKQAHCEYGQGFFFSEPLSSEEATTLLKQKLKG